MAARLSGVMDELISPNQSLFLKGRFLVDGVVIVNELLYLAKKSKKPCLILKLIFRKSMILLTDIFLTICFMSSGLMIGR